MVYLSLSRQKTRKTLFLTWPHRTHETRNKGTQAKRQVSTIRTCPDGSLPFLDNLMDRSVGCVPRTRPDQTRPGEEGAREGFITTSAASTSTSTSTQIQPAWVSWDCTQSDPPWMTVRMQTTRALMYSSVRYSAITTGLLATTPVETCGVCVCVACLSSMVCKLSLSLSTGVATRRTQSLLFVCMRAGGGGEVEKHQPANMRHGCLLDASCLVAFSVVCFRFSLPQVPCSTSTSSHFRSCLCFCFSSMSFFGQVPCRTY
jgi:hypothetical protein